MAGQRLASSARKLPYCSGVQNIGSKPSLAIAAASSGDFIASAAAEPAALYTASDGFEAQEFRRTASRLIEMRSAAYLARPHGRWNSTASGVVEGIAET